MKEKNGKKTSTQYYHVIKSKADKYDALVNSTTADEAIKNLPNGMAVRVIDSIIASSVATESYIINKHSDRINKELREYISHKFYWFQLMLWLYIVPLVFTAYQYFAIKG